MISTLRSFCIGELLRKHAVEGEEAFERFDNLIGNVMTVPASEIRRRNKEHRASVNLRGKKRR
jgi:hypothetical protein